MNDKQLPPLPDPHIGLPWRHNAPDGSIHSSAFTAEQMREYALEAIAQERAQQPSVTVRYDLSPAMVEGAIRDRLIAMGWTPPLQQPKPQQLSGEWFCGNCRVPVPAPQPAKQPVPEGWVPLTIEHEPGYPEDVAFGPQRMMDRLKKWLDRYFEMLNQPKPQPMTDELFDLICNAIDKADTITMEGDYMLDSDDCIAVVRVMQALLSVHHGITAQAKKESA